MKRGLSLLRVVIEVALKQQESQMRGQCRPPPPSFSVYLNRQLILVNVSFPLCGSTSFIACFSLCSVSAISPLRVVSGREALVLSAVNSTSNRDFNPFSR